MNPPPLVVRIRDAYSLLIRGGTLLRSPFLLAVRLYWGWQFFGTGGAKLDQVAEFTTRFAEWGVPLPHLSVIAAGSVERYGGLLLLVGLASRLVSIPLIFTMMVAYCTAETEALHQIFSDPDKFVSAAPFQFLFAALLVLIFGPGAFSVDHLLGKKLGPAASNSGLASA